eukprot:2862623-Rhodomonas_salina.3
MESSSWTGTEVRQKTQGTELCARLTASTDSSMSVPKLGWRCLGVSARGRSGSGLGRTIQSEA